MKFLYQLEIFLLSFKLKKSQKKANRSLNVFRSIVADLRKSNSKIGKQKDELTDKIRTYNVFCDNLLKVMQDNERIASKVEDTFL